MADEASVLVVANVTSTSRELIETLKERAAEGPCHFTLLMPHKPEGSEDAMRERLEEAMTRMRDAGLKVEDGRLGESDPAAAVSAIWDPARFDGIVISTLPEGRSEWLEADVPRRVEKATGVEVTQVQAIGSGRATFNP